AAKAGVVAMTKTIARQYGRKGVTAFSISPGFVDTAFNTPLVEEPGMDLFVNDTALGEVAQPQDIANVIAFLASGRARHATGATIDGNKASYGWEARAVGRSPMAPGRVAAPVAPSACRVRRAAC